MLAADVIAAPPNVSDNWNESVKSVRLEVDQAKARALGVTDVEIRNDTPNVVGTLAPADVKAAAKAAAAVASQGKA